MSDNGATGMAQQPVSSSEWQWKSLSTSQVGRYGEYWVKMELTRQHLDIFTAEIDDHGIDVVVRSRDGNRYADIQVKTVRSLTYVFMTDEVFPLRNNLYVALVLLFEGQPPQLCLIPQSAWEHKHAYLVHHDYVGLKSKPESNPSAALT